MNSLAIGAVSGIVIACHLLLGLFLLRTLAIKLSGTTAGEGLAAIIL